MQKIFFNANIFSLNEENTLAQAMLVNDGSIVLVGTNEEILEMKQPDTICVDLNKGYVVPSFFDVNLNIFSIIENELKNAKLIDNVENNAEYDENTENFDNYELYKSKLIEIQQRLIDLGITTIFEKNIIGREFLFWKKIAEDKVLKIDIIGYVDIKTSKAIMDNNCRSYRKYKNHFRLGGYSLTIDGPVHEKTAWLDKAYRLSKGYSGYTEIYEEELSFLIKSALEEKKQLLVNASGDRAVRHFVECFDRVVEKDKIDDTYRPAIFNSNLLSSSLLKKISSSKISVGFNVFDLYNFGPTIKKFVGLRRQKNYMPISSALRQDIKVLLYAKESDVVSIFDALKIASSRVMCNKKIHSKNEVVNNEFALKMICNNSAYIAFEQEQKGSLENGKHCNFLVLKNDPFKESVNEILEVYEMGEKIK